MSNRESKENFTRTALTRRILEFLQQFRELQENRHGWQTELAQHLGFTRGYVSKILHATDIGPRTAERIAIALGVDPQQLLDIDAPLPELGALDVHRRARMQRQQVVEAKHSAAAPIRQRAEALTVRAFALQRRLQQAAPDSTPPSLAELEAFVRDFLDFWQPKVAHAALQQSDGAERALALAACVHHFCAQIETLMGGVGGR